MQESSLESRGMDATDLFFVNNHHTRMDIRANKSTCYSDPGFSSMATSYKSWDMSSEALGSNAYETVMVDFGALLPSGCKWVLHPEQPRIGLTRGSEAPSNADQLFAEQTALLNLYKECGARGAHCVCRIGRWKDGAPMTDPFLKRHNVSSFLSVCPPAYPRLLELAQSQFKDDVFVVDPPPPMPDDWRKLVQSDDYKYVVRT